MKIQSTTLPSLLADRNTFVQIYTNYCAFALRDAKLTPQFSKAKLIEARGAWDNDLKRVEAHEPNLTEGLDHFKQASHLVFWLRRMSPLIDMSDNTKNFGDAEGMPLTDRDNAFRDLLLPYANEYLAFDFGFQIVKFYELGKKSGSDRAEKLTMPSDYYSTVCHFLKYKTVSPHAINLVYRSLFMV